MHRLSVHRHQGNALCRQCCNKRIRNRVVYPRIFLRRYPIFCRNVEVIPQQNPGVWCPFEPLRSNIELTRKKNYRLYFFVEKYISKAVRDLLVMVFTHRQQKLINGRPHFYTTFEAASIQSCSWNQPRQLYLLLSCRIELWHQVLEGYWPEGGGDIGANKGHLYFLNGEAMIKSARTELKVNGTRLLTSFNSC